jgi:hypothetical protein
VKFRVILYHYDSDDQSNTTQCHVALMHRSESVQEHCLNYGYGCLCFHRCGVIFKIDDEFGTDLHRLN